MTYTNASKPGFSTCSAIEAAQRRNFADALAVARSGVLAIIDETAEQQRRRGGFPRRLSNEALLTGFLYATLERNEYPTPASVANAMNLLPEDWLAQIGLQRDRSSDVAVTRSQVGHAWERLAEACDASPSRAGRRLHLDAEGAADRSAVVDAAIRPHPSTSPDDVLGSGTSTAPDLRSLPRDVTTEEAARRGQLLVTVCNRLLQASLPDGLHYDMAAIDWTSHESGTGPGDRHSTSADPDARYGVRQKKVDEDSLAGGQPRSLEKHGDQTPSKSEARKATIDPLGEDDEAIARPEIFFGYDLHLAVDVGDVDDARCPELALPMRVAPLSDPSVVTCQATELLDRVRDAGHLLRGVGADRGYTVRSPEALPAVLLHHRRRRAERFGRVLDHFHADKMDVLGRAKHTLVLAIVVAAANIHQLRRWEEDGAGTRP